MHALRPRILIRGRQAAVGSHLSRLRGRSTRSKERGGWGKSIPSTSPFCGSTPLPNPPPQAGEERTSLAVTTQSDLITSRGENNVLALADMPGNHKAFDPVDDPEQD